MRILLISVAALLTAPALAQGASPASPPAAAGAPAAQPAKPPKPKMICRPVAAATGTHMGSNRECHTAEYWKALNDADVDTGGLGSGRTVRSESAKPE
ncbi:hypothetical protein ACOYW6_02790 [Parablastomonas sp. CN1-191]|uniref:hypothetical protein n=1 Tax=Parablastomonas sp. CN1-191 TaxID=3400908 RepID=UPI003BF8FCB4